MAFLFNVPENMTNVVEVLTTSNSFVDGMMGVGILLIVFFGTLFLTSSFGTKESFVATGFVSMLISVFLRFLGLIDDWVMWITGVIFISLIVWSYSTKTPGVGA